MGCLLKAHLDVVVHDSLGTVVDGVKGTSFTPACHFEILCDQLLKACAVDDGQEVQTGVGLD